MMWGYFQSCCGGASVEQVIGYRFYSDNSVRLSDTAESLSLKDQPQTLSITEAPEHLQIELTKGEITLTDEPETVNVDDSSEDFCDC